MALPSASSTLLPGLTQSPPSNLRGLYSAELGSIYSTAGILCMKGFHALGVTQISDLYPNVKYKLVVLRELFGHGYVEYLSPLNKSDNSPGIFSAINSGRIAFAWRFLLGHIKVMFYTLRHRAESAYICYPGIFLTAWLSLPFTRNRFPVVYLDAFISLYDTIVFDRGILKQSSLLAKLLYRIEKKAFEAATIVVVDTPENAQFYADLFDIPAAKFCPIPLCIPAMSPSPDAMKSNMPTTERVRCVFVGTFVPLQGIRTIVEAAKLLGPDPNIDFVIIGDGQEAKYLQDYLATTPNANMTWHRGHFPTQFIIDHVSNSDICLGIFGDGPKAQRVLPYKIYYYLALGMPVVTAATATADRILVECRDSGEHEPFALVPTGAAQSLADMLCRLRDYPEERVRLGTAGANYYRRALSDAAIQRSLQVMLQAA